MDRSFQSPSFLTASQSGRPSMGGNSSFLGGRPNPLAKKASSRMSISARSNQSQQIIAKSNYNVVKSYGNSLPVLVTEALTFTDRNSEVTISVSPTEWAWVSASDSYDVHSWWTPNQCHLLYTRLCVDVAYWCGSSVSHGPALRG